MRYAYTRAGRYFRDAVLREDAASDAVNNAIDKWVNDVLDKKLGEDCFDEELAKRVIQSSLRQSSRKRQLEPISTEENNMHGYKVI